MFANNSLIKNILIIVLVLIVGGWALGIIGSLLWLAVRLLIPCAIIYGIVRWISDRSNASRRRKF
ncbi:hypothetical protein I6N96_04125 [Enterococcus sp. BWM-S5]|uniref:Uncharacterized protein n=1 Tax=Enterococcus larvae TaxID=2794352 RepID=A0ABS4CFP5_9ENTE|nr:hypothetical protein [Enterococcus larvae]MBP1045451.1 hypothetical protein [Enterococcus larvae]